MRCSAHAALLVATQVCPAWLAAQTLEEVRENLREAAAAERFPLFAAGLLGLAEESELSGGNFRITDGGEALDLQVLTLPVRREFGMGERWPRLLVEGVLGYSEARTRIGDIWGGGLPGAETTVAARFESLGGLVGAGPLLPLGGGWELGLLANAGLAHVTSDAYYVGPGAGASAAILDGILFNWDATYAIYGASALLRREGWRWGDVEISPLLRYEARHVVPIQTDDRSHDDESTIQWLVARLGVEGPTGWSLGDGQVRWLGQVGGKAFDAASADALGFGHYFELGGGLRWDCSRSLPVFRAATLSGALFAGDDITGWTIGLSVAF